MSLKSIIYFSSLFAVGANFFVVPDALAIDSNRLLQNKAVESDASPRYGTYQGDLTAMIPPVSPTTVNLVKQFEGFSSRAYIDTSGLPVIGYGQSKINGRKVRMGQYITQAQAEVALKQELYHIQKLVLAHVMVDLNHNQLGALTSLVYNSGLRILKKSTLIRKLNSGNYIGAANEFVRWNKANRGGRLVVFSGLTRRRLAEQKLFMTSDERIIVHS